MHDEQLKALAQALKSLGVPDTFEQAKANLLLRLS
jgi:hypothetical protein